MKKILVSLFVLGLLLVGSNQAQASTLSELKAQINELKGELTLLRTFQKASVINTISTGDTNSRIMYWPGKVNQHIDSNGAWQTDIDGTSGAQINQLNYCKKFWPDTTSVEAYKNETISTWHDAGNRNAYTATRMSYKCVQEGAVEETPSIKVLSPNGGESYKLGDEITIKWTSKNIPSKSYDILLLDYVNNAPCKIGTTNVLNNSFTTILSSDDCLQYSFTKLNLTPGKYKVFINDPNSGDEWLSDTSDDYFTITSSNTLPPSSITVLSPNGGESYKVGDKINIKWLATNVKNNTVSIALAYPSSDSSSNYNGAYKVAYDINNTGSYMWTIPSELRTECESGSCVTSFDKNFKISIFDEGYPRFIDLSDNSFTINSLVNQVTLKLGIKKTISFNNQTFLLELKSIDDGSGSYKIEVNGRLVNGWSLGMELPILDYISVKGLSYSTIRSGTQSVTLQLLKNNNKLDVGIKDTPTNTSITVLSPNGGESYKVGQPMIIKLGGGLYSTRVGLVNTNFNPNIKISDNNDVHWMSLSSDAGKSFVWDGLSFINNDGSKSYWSSGSGNYKIVAIRDIDNSKCYINKVSDCSYDMSDSLFTITPSSDSLVCTISNIYSLLQMGSHGDQVRSLQQILVNKGYLTSDNVSGYFGQKTKLALMKFQKANGLSPVGMTGPKTRTLINTALASLCTEVVDDNY